MPDQEAAMGSRSAPSGRRALVSVLAWLAVIVVPLAALARAEPVPGWSFTTWSATPGEVKASAERAKLAVTAVSSDDAAMFGLPRSTVPFAFQVNLYRQPSVAYPIFRHHGLIAVRFVVTEPVHGCPAVLHGLTADYGPGTASQRGYSNVNWPTNNRFGLTVLVTPDFCWPLFSRPGP